MNVKDLLMTCATEEIVAMYVETYVETYGKAKDEDSLRKVIELLRDLEPIDTKYLLIVEESELFGKKHIGCGVCSKKVINHKSKWEKALAKFEKAEEMNVEEQKQLLASTPLLKKYCISHTLWEEVLGYEISRHNIEKIGASRFLAEAIYNMTFFGYQHKSIEEIKEEIEKELEEFGSIESWDKAKVEETIKKHEAGKMVVEQLPPEESIYQESVRNRIDTYKMILACFDNDIF